MLLDLALALFMVNINMPRASNILYFIMYSVSQLLQLFCYVNNISLYFVEFYASFCTSGKRASAAMVLQKKTRSYVGYPVPNSLLG